MCQRILFLSKDNVVLDLPVPAPVADSTLGLNLQLAWGHDFRTRVMKKTLWLHIPN